MCVLSKDWRVWYSSYRIQFGKVLFLFEKKLDLLKDVEYDKRFQMIKPWNEWAEENYMESDLKFGMQI